MPSSHDELWYLTYQLSTGGFWECTPPPLFDYSNNGSVFFQDGTIFYSPNCSQPAIILPQTTYSSSPFNQPHLNASMFKQPTWWSEFWGWVSFIPLDLSFTSTPFVLFYWAPWIEKVEVSFHLPSGLEEKEMLFRMSLDDSYLWKKSEGLVVEATHRIQLFFGIQRNAPPAPSTFHYDRPHKSYAVAKCMISISHDWFIVWMGFLSYLISHVELCHPDAHLPFPTSPLHDWYNLLWNKDDYPGSWLDSLSSSTVCYFHLKTPQAGIVFHWVNSDNHCPNIEWFYHHHVPLWFTWTNAEEQAIRSNHRLACLEPPVEIVQQALTILFTSLNLPLAGLIMKKYYKLGNDPITSETLDLLQLEHAPSIVYEVTAMMFINQTSAIWCMEVTASKDLRLFVKSRKRDHQSCSIFPCSRDAWDGPSWTKGQTLQSLQWFFFCKGQTAGRDDQSGVCSRPSTLRVAWVWPSHKKHNNVYLGEGVVIWWSRIVYVGSGQ